MLQQRADDIALETALRGEEDEERARDRLYWQPLKVELEMLDERAVLKNGVYPLSKNVVGTEETRE